MPEEENTTQQQEQQDPLKGTKFEGKSVEDVLRAYEELETRLGAQGAELGQLRALVQSWQTERPRTAESGPREYVDRYRRYADELIVNPEEALPKLAEEIRREVLTEATRTIEARLQTREALENFFESNPDLKKYRRETLVIGEMIYQQNPHLPFSQVLEETARQTRAWLGSVKARMQDLDSDRVSRAITTSGGGRARDAAEAEAAAPARASGLSAEEEAVLDEIRSFKESRAKRAVPPRSR